VTDTRGLEITFPFPDTDHLYKSKVSGEPPSPREKGFELTFSHPITLPILSDTKAGALFSLTSSERGGLTTCELVSPTLPPVSTL